MKKYLVEFIGTFFLLLTIIAAVNGGAGNLAPVAIGSALMVMVYAGGHISGAHYNPAVTVAAWIRGALPVSEILPYIVAQVAGAALAAIVATNVLGFPTTIGTINTTPALVAELLGTFALVYVILNVATAKSTSGNSYFGLAIGFTVTAMAYALGGISGGAFNPAVALGVTIAGMSAWANIWVFMVACFLGGILAAYVFKFVYYEDKD